MKVYLDKETLAEVSDIVIANNFIGCCDIHCMKLDIDCRDCKFHDKLFQVKSINKGLIECGEEIEIDED